VLIEILLGQTITGHNNRIITTTTTTTTTTTKTKKTQKKTINKIPFFIEHTNSPYLKGLRKLPKSDHINLIITLTLVK
jgi:hypothetical protein